VGTDTQDVTVKLVEAETQEGALEEAIKKAKVDMSAWSVERWKAKKYSGFFRSRSYQTPGMKNDWRRQATVLEMWSVEVSFVRKVPTAVDELEGLRRAMLAEMKKKSPAFPAVKYPHVAAGRESFMYEISIPDLHNGKLAWAPETGDNYDSGISQNLFSSAITHLMRSVEHLQLECIQLPLGHDFFHVDNHTNTTTGGTPQDVDSRWFKTVRRMRETVVANILELRKVAPVKVIIVPGNHDQTRMLTFGEILEGWLHKCRDVEIDNSPKLRKYSRFGINLIGHTHGNEEKAQDLPLLMACEAKKDWAECECFEWHTGHLHIRRNREVLTTDTNKSVVLRTLPSLSGTDAWHFKRGYVLAPRAADALLYEKRTGYAGHYTYNYWRERQSIA
jgi:hypothetical protein